MCGISFLGANYGGAFTAMSIRDWNLAGVTVLGGLFLGLFLGGLWIGTEKAANAERERQYAEVAATNPDEELYRRCDVLPTREEAFQCFREQVAASREGQRSEHDLSAQRSMAQSAFIMLLVTGGLGLLTFALSAVATYLLRETLSETRGANQIARDDRRAWIGFDSVIISPDARVDANQVHVTVKVALKNYGSSPAHSVWFHTAIYADGEAIQAYRREIDPVANRFIGDTIFPGSIKPEERLSTIQRTDIERHIESRFPVSDFLPDPDRIPVGLCVLVHVRYRIDGDEKPHDTGQYYPITGSGADGRWFRREGNHPIHNWGVGMSVNPSPWAT